MAAALLRRALHLRRVLPSPTTPLPAAYAHRLLSSAAPTTAASQQNATVTTDLSADEMRRLLVDRCKQGAFLGMGRWIDQNVHSMDEAGIRTLLLAIDPERPDVLKWLTGQEQAPEDLNSDPVFSVIKSKITGYLTNNASPEK